MATVTLYGIPNCDTVKKARTWLDDHGREFQFHDFKKAGLTPAIVQSWLKQVDWEVLVNRKGTTWRALPDERKAAIIDAESATALMLESPSVIKRPVMVSGASVHVGFSDDSYQQFFQK
jgi:arsenate reductase